MTLLAQEVIRRKRNGAELGADELAFMVRGITDNSLSEGQVAAFAMAVWFSGMTLAERVAFTTAMVQSGTTLDWSDAGLDRPVLDKHSTGGVGDKVSLVLGPLVAACGGAVPMISGRGLGHTGGTLDKLESLPGYNVTPDAACLRRVVREVGCAIIGQSAELAPADRRLYAIRDVTATVDSVPLITASILSKKLAAGLDALVMDVKCGSGAFADTPDTARELADSITRVAAGAGLPCSALITDMDRVLGRSVGHALEVHEAIACLRGDPVDARLRSLVLELAAELLVLGGLDSAPDAARRRAEQALTNGSAAAVLEDMVAALGGPTDVCSRAPDLLPAAPVTLPVHPQATGVVTAVDARAVGIAVVGLGGGRRRPEDQVDHAVGLTAVAAPGEPVDRERPLALVHARDQASAEEAAAALRQAFRIGDRSAAEQPLVLARTTALPE